MAEQNDTKMAGKNGGKKWRKKMSWCAVSLTCYTHGTMLKGPK